MKAVKNANALKEGKCISSDIFQKVCGNKIEGAGRKF